MTRIRYRALLRAAVEDVAADPVRRGSVERPELGSGVRTWRIRLSRYSSSEPMVRNPRHFLVYRVDANEDTVTIGRVLHERMDLARHIDDQMWV